MEQSLYRSLRKYHGLFTAKRCDGWELEELIHRAIQQDNAAGHHSKWKEAGHDTEADIDVHVNGTTHRLQIKSGKVKKRCGTLVLSGHRLGRFDGNLSDISQYLNTRTHEILAVPYRQINDHRGRRHCYRLCYVDSSSLADVRADAWAKQGQQWRQTNESGVLFSLRPSMSWQIWWEIPSRLLTLCDEQCI